MRRAICPRGDATRDASWSTRGARPKPAAPTPATLAAASPASPMPPDARSVLTIKTLEERLAASEAEVAQLKTRVRRISSELQGQGE